MDLENFIYSIDNEIKQGLEKISKNYSYLKKPIFKGPHQIWYCQIVDNHNPNVIIEFYCDIFSVEFKKLRTSSGKSNDEKNAYNLLYKLTSGLNQSLTKQFEENIVKLYDQYITEYINSFKEKIQSKIKLDLKEFDNRNSKQTLKKTIQYFEEPNLKVFKIIKGSKTVRHKRGEGFWISVHEKHSYEIWTKENAQFNGPIIKYKEYLKKRERNVHYEESYVYQEEQSVEFSSKQLDLEFSFMLNHIDLKILYQEVKQSYFGNHRNWITPEILLTYTFLTFGDIPTYLTKVKYVYGHNKYLLYDSLFKIYRAYLDRSTHHLSNGYMDYSNDLKFNTPAEFDKLKENIYNKINQIELDTYFNNFVINCNLEQYEYKEIMKSIYIFLNDMNKKRKHNNGYSK